MANPDSLNQQTAYNLGNYAVGIAQNVSLTNTGNAVAAIPLLVGGLTNSGSVASSGSVIIRRITFQNPSGNIGTANVAILTSSDGNASNAVVSAVVLSSMAGVGTWQDATIASQYATVNVVSGANTQALFVQVNTAVTGAKLDIKVYGDVVAF